MRRRYEEEDKKKWRGRNRGRKEIAKEIREIEGGSRRSGKGKGNGKGKEIEDRDRDRDRERDREEQE